MSGKNTKALLIIGFITLFVLLDYSYRTYLAVFHTDWFYQSNPSLVSTLVSLSLLAIYLIIFYVIKQTNVWLLLNTLTYIFFLLPSLVIYRNDPKFGFNLLAVEIFFTSLVLFFSQIKLSLPHKKLKNDLIYWLSLVLIIFVAIWLTIRFKHINVKLTSIKGFLSENKFLRAQVSKNISSLGYLFNWTLKFAIPLATIISIRRKKWLVTLAVFSITLWIYMLVNVRFILFIILVSAFFAFVNDLKKSAVLLVYGLALAGLLGIFLRTTGKTDIIESLVCRRFLIVPQYHNIAYLQTFKDLHLHLSYSKLAFFEHNPLDMQPGYYVGQHYYHRPLLNASNGFISQGFADFGYLGGYLYSFFAALILWTLGNLEIKPVYSGWIFVFYFSLVSAFLNSFLITHAGLLILLYLFLFE